jgi:hypothetical protein
MIRLVQDRTRNLSFGPEGCRRKSHAKQRCLGSARLGAAYLGYRRPTTWGRWMLFLGDVIIKYQEYKSAELVNHTLLEVYRDDRILS